MKISNSAVIVSVAASFAYAYDASNTPACALPCMERAVTESGCTAADMRCQCTTGHQMISVNSLTCVQKACSAEDVSKIMLLNRQICDSVFIGDQSGQMKPGVDPAAQAAQPAVAQSNVANPQQAQILMAPLPASPPPAPADPNSSAAMAQPGAVPAQPMPGQDMNHPGATPTQPMPGQEMAAPAPAPGAPGAAEGQQPQDQPMPGQDLTAAAAAAQAQPIPGQPMPGQDPAAAAAAAQAQSVLGQPMPGQDPAAALAAAQAASMPGQDPAAAAAAGQMQLMPPQPMPGQDPAAQAQPVPGQPMPGQDPAVAAAAAPAQPLPGQEMAQQLTQPVQQAPGPEMQASAPPTPPAEMTAPNTQSPLMFVPKEAPQEANPPSGAGTTSIDVPATAGQINAEASSIVVPSSPNLVAPAPAFTAEAFAGGGVKRTSSHIFPFFAALFAAICVL